MAPVFSKPQSMMTMLVSFLALLHVSVAFQHGAHHHAHKSRALNADSLIEAQISEIQGELFKRQSSGTIAITGVCSSGTGSNGRCNGGRSAAPRLEIRQLAGADNKDPWNLYLLGMERFMAKDKSDPLSYYQIAGVHGRPFVSWNNFPSPLVNQAGFCPHGSSLFGTWHRPYLAVYEQGWYQAVQEVIATFPSDQQQRWQDAASNLRMPYWDWAMDGGKDTVPSVIRDQKVTVTKPSGQVTIDNPLYSYKFGDRLPAEIGGGPWNSFPQTLRRPVGNPTRSNNNEMNARFNAQRISLRDRIFALFSSKQDWGDASTEAIGVRTDLSGSGVDSFESLHDMIHNTAGGESGGYMYYLDISAFDPIFWLHHCNLDRLLAMYQLITPRTYVSRGRIARPMAQWNQGETKDRYSPLKPFTKDTRGNYFTSEDIRETRTLGYYYPETSDNSYSQVAQAITNLYGAGRRTMNKRSTPTGQYDGRPFKEGDYHTVLTVTADKYAMKGSYTVHCFVGKPGRNSTHSSNAPYGNHTAPYPVPLNSTAPYSNSTGDADYDPSTDYTQDPNYVGAYGILGGMMAGGSNSSQPLMTSGSIPLTTCLQGKEYYGELESLAPEHVEPYLAENLYYKVVGINGEMNPDDIPNFHISVKCTKVTPPTSDNELPDLSAPYQQLPKVTENKPAGKPFVYTPSPLDTPAPEGSGSEEEGYCSTKQTVHYVDPAGNFLYASM